MRQLISKTRGLLVVFGVILTLCMLSGCTTGNRSDRMEYIEMGWDYKILRDKETGVLYIGLKAYEPMVDAEGNILIEKENIHE